MGALRLNLAFKSLRERGGVRTSLGRDGPVAGNYPRRTYRSASLFGALCRYAFRRAARFISLAARVRTPPSLCLSGPISSTLRKVKCRVR